MADGFLLLESTTAAEWRISYHQTLVSQDSLYLSRPIWSDGQPA
jgi:hypothetical protein